MLRLQPFAATRKMRLLLVILIIGISWQNILARGGLVSSSSYSDHEERLQRLETLMLSQGENDVVIGHEERLQMLEAWASSQNKNKDNSYPYQIYSIYFEEEDQDRGGRTY